MDTTGLSVAPQNALLPESITVNVDAGAKEQEELLKVAYMSKYGIAELESILRKDPMFLSWVSTTKPDMSTPEKIVAAFARMCQAEPTIDCNKYVQFVMEPTLPSGAVQSVYRPIGVSASGLAVVATLGKTGAPSALLYCTVTNVPLTRAWTKLTHNDLPQLATSYALGVYDLIVSGYDAATGTIWWLDLAGGDTNPVGRVYAAEIMAANNVTGTVLHVLATHQHAALITDCRTVVLIELGAGKRHAVVKTLEEKLYQHGTPASDKKVRLHRPTCIAFDQINPLVFLVGTDQGFVYVYELWLEAPNTLEVSTHLLPATTEPEYDGKMFKFQSREPLDTISFRKGLHGGTMLSTTMHSMTCVLYDALAAASAGTLLLRRPISCDRDLSSPYVSTAFCGTNILVHNIVNNTIQIKSISNTGTASELETVVVEIPDSRRSATGYYQSPQATYQYQSTFICIGLAVVMMPDGMCVFIAPAGGSFANALQKATADAPAV